MTKSTLEDHSWNQGNQRQSRAIKANDWPRFWSLRLAAKGVGGQKSPLSPRGELSDAKISEQNPCCS